MERPTIISQSNASGARIQIDAPAIPQGAFGEYSGLASLGNSIGQIGDAYARERKANAAKAKK